MKIILHLIKTMLLCPSVFPLLQNLCYILSTSFILWSMTPQVIEGHIRSPLCSKSNCSLFFISGLCTTRWHGNTVMRLLEAINNWYKNDSAFWELNNQVELMCSIYTNTHSGTGKINVIVLSLAPWHALFCLLTTMEVFQDLVFLDGTFLKFLANF